jgi:SHS2 domain-containing protein
LFSAVVDDLSTIEPRQRIDIRLTSDDLEYLLFDWLKELLYRFDTEHLLLGRFDVKVADCSLEAVAWGEPMDLARHTMLHEVKAITYHALKVERTTDGWMAEVIVDI